MNNKKNPSDFDVMSDYETLGGFSLLEGNDYQEGIEDNPFSELNPPFVRQTQYRIIVKRDDGLYRALHIINTLFSIIGVLLIVAIFGMVFYSLITITEVSEIVHQIKEHNEIVPSPR